jgi:FixJ family two-component response regulator
MASVGHPRRAHIVVLDDDREMGAWLVDLLTEEGYTAEAYQQGTDLLVALEQLHRVGSGSGSRPSR